MLQFALFVMFPVFALYCLGFHSAAWLGLKVFVFVVIALCGVVFGGCFTVMADPSAAEVYGRAWHAAGPLICTAKIANMVTMLDAFSIPYWFIVDCAYRIFLFGVVCGGVVFWGSVTISSIVGYKVATRLV